MFDHLKAFILGVLWTIDKTGRYGASNTASYINKVINPDGLLSCTWFTLNYATYNPLTGQCWLLAGGMFPGQVVKGYKGRFQINGVNLLKLEDDTMLKTTQWYSGTICMTVGLYPSYSANNSLNFGLATQYCDGLRGTFIVYDPHDSHQLLYDIDDGKHKYLNYMSLHHRVYYYEVIGLFHEHLANAY